MIITDDLRQLANVLSELGDDAKTIKSVLQNKSPKEIVDLAEKSGLSLDDFLDIVPSYLSEMELKEVGK